MNSSGIDLVDAISKKMGWVFEDSIVRLKSKGWSRDEMPSDSDGYASNLIEDWENNFRFVQRKVKFFMDDGRIVSVRDSIWTADAAFIDEESFEKCIDTIRISARFDAFQEMIGPGGIVVYELYKIDDVTRSKLIAARDSDGEILWDERYLIESERVYALHSYSDHKDAHICESKLEWSEIDALP